MLYFYPNDLETQQEVLGKLVFQPTLKLHKGERKECGLN